MKKTLIALLAATMYWQVNAAEATWLTDLPKAEAQAKAENKIVLLDFTGSDWCGWCIKFKKEVLDTAEFQEYATRLGKPTEHKSPDLLPQSVYGVAELRRDEIKKSKLVGNPGRFAVGVEIGLAPVKPAEFVIFRIGQWTADRKV